MAVNKEQVKMAALALLPDDGTWDIYVGLVLEQPGMERTLDQAMSVDDIAKLVAYDAEWQRKKGKP